MKAQAKQITPTLNNFVASTFAWMFTALAISAIFAIGFMTSPTAMDSMYRISTEGKHQISMLGIGVMSAPIIVALAMIFLSKSLPKPIMNILFIVYSAINGISFSMVLSHYTHTSIIGAFLSAAVMFGIFALYGYNTKKDLTGWGNIFLMALIGLILSSLVNFLLASTLMSYIISAIAIVVFSALTAYDVQKIKEHYYDNEPNGAIMAAFELYLDFINLFLNILRLFGNSKD